MALLSSPESRRRATWPMFATYLLLPPLAPPAATACRPHPAIIPAAAKQMFIESMVAVGRDSVARSTSRQHAYESEPVSIAQSATAKGDSRDGVPLSARAEGHQNQPLRTLRRHKQPPHDIELLWKVHDRLNAPSGSGQSCYTSSSNCTAECSRPSESNGLGGGRQ